MPFKKRHSKRQHKRRTGGKRSRSYIKRRKFTMKHKPAASMSGG